MSMTEILHGVEPLLLAVFSSPVVFDVICNVPEAGTLPLTVIGRSTLTDAPAARVCVYWQVIVTPAGVHVQPAVGAIAPKLIFAGRGVVELLTLIGAVVAEAPPALLTTRWKNCPGAPTTN